MYKFNVIHLKETASGDPVNFYIFEVFPENVPKLKFYKLDDKDHIETYNSEEKARKAAEEFLKNDINDYVFVVLKNTNFTDGYGHMYVDEIFKDAENAHQHIMKNKGIMGTEQHIDCDRSYLFVKNEKGKIVPYYGYTRYNGYELKATKLK